jgi:rubredoxin
MHTESVYINFKGGIISPGYLRQLLDVASAAHVEEVCFGLRQQLIMEVPAERFQAFASGCAAKNIGFHTSEDRLPNIVSSYAGVNIFMNDSWLSEGIYKDVFDLFNYEPLLKINVCDGKQSFTPLFTGHLNWIASSHQHYWFLYVRLPKSDRMFCWPELIYTNDLAKLSQQLERIILSVYKENPLADQLQPDILVQLMKQTVTCISKPVNEKLVFPSFHLPYYEGFNRDGNNHYWLGIYRRDEMFAVSFLKDLCNVCLQNKIGQVYATTWKSLVIKGIPVTARQTWDQVLGKHRINVRHAANELNWQVEDRNEDGLILKRHVIRHFDKEDVRTYGLCFAVKTMPSSQLFGSIFIRKQQRKNPNKLKSLERYDILYKKDFNPNGSELILFRDNVEKDYIGTYLVSLCKFYYEKQSANALPVHEEFISEPASAAAVPEQPEYVYQCTACLSVYDNQFEDESNQLPPGQPFESLPETYECNLCGAHKKDFVKVEKSTVYDGV